MLFATIHNQRNQVQKNTLQILLFVKYTLLKEYKVSNTYKKPNKKKSEKKKTKKKHWSYQIRLQGEDKNINRNMHAHTHANTNTHASTPSIKRLVRPHIQISKNKSTKQ